VQCCQVCLEHIFGKQGALGFRLLVCQVEVAGRPALVQLGDYAVDECTHADGVDAAGALCEGAAALGERLQVREKQLRRSAAATNARCIKGYRSPRRKSEFGRKLKWLQTSVSIVSRSRTGSTDPSTWVIILFSLSSKHLNR
jgi:hypothetical protein